MSLPEFETRVSSKAMVQTLSRLNMLAYPELKAVGGDTWFPPNSIIDPVYAAGEGIFGGSNDRDKEMAYLQTLRETIIAEVKNTPGAHWDYKYTPKSAFDTIGVAALEFTRGNLTVIVFRGSRTTGDGNNIFNWIIDWVLGSMTARMKEAWTSDAGLAWDSELSSRADQGTLKQVLAIQTAALFLTPFLSTSFASNLAAAVSQIANFSLSQDEASRVGYWPIVRKIADDARAAARARGHELHFSGHSQGGSNVQLASMYLRKRYGEVYNGTTFAATGTQCAARRLSTGGNFLGAAPLLPAPPVLNLDRSFIHAADRPAPSLKPPPSAFSLGRHWPLPSGPTDTAAGGRGGTEREEAGWGAGGGRTQRVWSGRDR
jgi:hypothetical protein